MTTLLASKAVIRSHGAVNLYLAASFWSSLVTSFLPRYGNNLPLDELRGKDIMGINRSVMMSGSLTAIWQWVLNNAIGIQASTAMVAALGGLGVLRGYALDTRKIADATSNQTKDGLMPYLALVLSRSDQDPADSLASKFQLQNQGLGPAVNVKLWLQDEPALRQRHSLMTASVADIVIEDEGDGTRLLEKLRSPNGFRVEYESLANERFRSTFRLKANDTDVVTFENLSRRNYNARIGEFPNIESHLSLSILTAHPFLCEAFAVA